MEANDTILRRIQKCLALSKSPNEHEAAAALRQATKLMEAYNVTPEALAANQLGEARAKTDAWTKPPQWEMDLLHLLKRAFGCDALLYYGNSDFQRLTEVLYIGPKHQAEVAAYAHETLRRQIVKARARHMDHWPWASGRAAKMAAGESFCRGFVSTLGKQVYDLAIDPTVAAAREARKQELLGDNASKKGYTAPRRGMDYSSYSAGAEQGKKASLHRGVNGEEQKKLGI